ncbi:FAD-dependent oxidoreductase [Kaistia dalseonensis]|uniref:D-amino-acid dehydrogenase n=1 Tax=Kaistia dalseonensis TaxID=410840 RepID=A0ABU0H8E4_9HYPH|nr:FAD-dependent oxidoreductase [Kaistia dalseonensis]MCX5495952.1 FAD-dependent oxidoreductase [Kaistia dalseonensis]MDQ0438555.1 D-amino-acid dehydrogenase [Kaistia dalseonensis]
MRVAVIGAGIIGVAAAHALLDEGHVVDLIDREGIAAGTSQGNAGWIAHVDIMPLASPKVWRNLPAWAFDPLGPLSIRPAYLPKLLPWLARFISASRPSRIEASVQAIAALNGRALPAWERRLDGLGLEGHLRRKGLLSIWDDKAAFEAARPLLARQRAMGIPVEELDQRALQALEPALGSRVIAGALYGTGCHVSDPRDLTLALGYAALDRGATARQFGAVALKPQADAIAIRTSMDSIALYDRVVVAAGAWSKPLAASLGDAIPLDTERGYNVTLPAGRLGLTRPVMFEGKGFVTTPLDTGDRIGGSVEFGGLDAAPNYKRVDAILSRLRRFLPDADLSGGTRWMGFRPSIPDSLPVIGRAAREPRVVYAFGHAHHGLTQAAATAEIVADLIADRRPTIDIAPYSPKRFAERF